MRRLFHLGRFEPTTSLYGYSFGGSLGGCGYDDRLLILAAVRSDLVRVSLVMRNPVFLLFFYFFFFFHSVYPVRSYTHTISIFLVHTYHSSRLFPYLPTSHLIRLQLREAREGIMDDFHDFFSNREDMCYQTKPTHTTIDRTNSTT